jgi:hypothetical protein
LTGAAAPVSRMSGGLRGARVQAVFRRRKAATLLKDSDHRY